MGKPAAIAGSLVDAKNIHSHKALRLIIEVPAEHAPRVFEAFGWPTMASPVPVAVARLNETAQPSAPEGAGGTAETAAKPSPDTIRQKWNDLRPSQQAALRCNDPEFHRFLSRTAPLYWRQFAGGAVDRAAQVVRSHTNVRSRREFDTDPDAAKRWHALDAEFWAWQRDPRRAA